MALRITNSNPPKYLWGVTADFDATLSPLEVAEGVTKRAAPGLLPRFSSVSYSGHARLTWQFEAPVFVDNEELADRFMKLLGKELRWNILLPGLDDASYKLGQYYEAGRDWTEFPGSKPIPSDLLGLLFFRAARQQKLTGDASTIPIEAVAEEIERRWPGRIQGEFTVGARTPLFWIDDGIDRIGALVGDHGMICFSTRAGNSFVTWGEILGYKFVREFEASRRRVFYLWQRARIDFLNVVTRQIFQSKELDAFGFFQRGRGGETGNSAILDVRLDRRARFDRTR